MQLRARTALTVDLGTAIDYTILAQSGISTVPQSSVPGDIGVSPAASGAITGFSPLLLDSSGTYGLFSIAFVFHFLLNFDRFSIATSPQVGGKVFAADYVNPTPGNLGTAVNDMQNAYLAASAQSPADYYAYGSGALGGAVLTPGLYNFVTDVTIGADLTLTGSSTDVYVFQIA